MNHKLISFVLAGCLTLGVNAQDSVTITSDPSDLSRPIATLLNQMRKHEKISVTYEDPRYSNSADIEDATSRVARNLSPAEERLRPRILVPRGKAISFVYARRDLKTTEGVEATIARMLSEYEALGGPKFVVTRDGTRLHVVPAEVLNANGERVSQGSVLDAVISIPQAEAGDSGDQLLQDICDQTQKQTGYKIDIGPGSLNMHGSKKGGDIGSQTARAALEEVWDSESARGSFVWNLFYDPSDKSYGLSFIYLGSAGPVVK
jgi:hypothetical protein